MRSAITPALGVATVFALALHIAPPASGSQSAPDSAIVRETVTSYQDAVDAGWTDPTASYRGPGETSAEELVHNVSNGLIADGAPVTSAKSEVRIADWSTEPDGKVKVTAEVSTTKTYMSLPSGRETTGIVTDRHSMLLSREKNGSYTVIADDALVERPPAAPADTAFKGDPPQPTDASPNRSGQDRGTSPMSAHSGTPTTPAYAVTASGGTLPAGFQEKSIDTTKMAEYAKKWTSPPYDGDNDDDYNHDYEKLDNNCANFASQALDAGGWDLQGGLLANDKTIWTHDVWVTGNASDTWAYARWSYQYVRNSSYEYLPYLYDATTGDLLYVDWSDELDERIDHVMVVTDRVDDHPYISQKTSNRSNIPLDEEIRIAKEQGIDEIVWYGLTPE